MPVAANRVERCDIARLLPQAAAGLATAPRAQAGLLHCRGRRQPQVRWRPAPECTKLTGKTFSTGVSAAVPNTIPLATVDSHCPYCALQCGMTLADTGTGAPEVRSRNFPTNKGGLCRKGWTSASLLQAPDRLTAPLLRNPATGKLEETTWDSALDFICDGIRTIQQRLGNDAISLFGGGGLTNEKAYLLGKFARVALKTRHIDYNGRFCMASGAEASQRAFGIDRGLPFPLEDLPKAEVILIAGGNPADTMPPIMQYFEEQQRRGGRLMVADPRRSATAHTADLHLQPAPGTDAALANGLLHILIRDHHIDRDFIARRTSGFERVRQRVGSYWPDRVERITGVPAAQLEQAAQMLGAARSLIVLSGRGVEQQTSGVNNDLALINLVLARGMVGKPGCGYGCLTGQGNGQGGREHGQKSDQLPGYRRIDDPAARAWIASIWNIDPDSLPGPGVSACEMFARFGETIGALLVFAANPLVSAPDAGQFRRQLQALDLLVVCDAFLSETAALADVVLPVTQWAEERGTMTNLEGRVLLRQPLRPPPPGVRSDTEVLHALAVRLGCSAGFDPDPETIFAELCRASRGGRADYSGITYGRIAAENGIFWPCPTPGHPGTPRLFQHSFPTPDGRARFHPVDYRATAEQPGGEYPLWVTTGRLLVHYQSGAQTRRVPELSETEPRPTVTMHPQMARTFAIADGDLVRVVTRRGSAVLHARLSSDIRLDTLFIPFHWGGEGCANLLTRAALDPGSKIPEFKISAGRIEPLAPSPHLSGGRA